MARQKKDRPGNSGMIKRPMEEFSTSFPNNLAANDSADAGIFKSVSAALFTPNTHTCPHLLPVLLGSVLGSGFMARCFPLPKGGMLAPGSEGVVWRVRCDIDAASQLASLAKSFACPWLGGRRRHRTFIYISFVLFTILWTTVP